MPTIDRMNGAAAPQFVDAMKASAGERMGIKQAVLASGLYPRSLPTFSRIG